MCIDSFLGDHFFEQNFTKIQKRGKKMEDFVVIFPFKNNNHQNLKYFNIFLPHLNCDFSLVSFLQIMFYYLYMF
jgi:hypothetical protein